MPRRLISPFARNVPSRLHIQLHVPVRPAIRTYRPCCESKRGLCELKHGTQEMEQAGVTNDLT
jgi:hypothetical protein